MPGDFPSIFEPDNLPVNTSQLDYAGMILQNQQTKLSLAHQAQLAQVGNQVFTAQNAVGTAAARHLNSIADVIDQQKGKISLATFRQAGEVAAQAMIAGAPPPSMLEPANALAPADQAAATQAMYQAAGVNPTALAVATAPAATTAPTATTPTTGALSPSLPVTAGADAGASGVSSASQAAPTAPADTSVYLIWSGYGTPIYSIPDTSNPPTGFAILGGPYSDDTKAAAAVEGAAGPGYQGDYNGQAPVASAGQPGSSSPTPTPPAASGSVNVTKGNPFWLVGPYLWVCNQSGAQDQAIFYVLQSPTVPPATVVAGPAIDVPTLFAGNPLPASVPGPCTQYSYFDTSPYIQYGSYPSGMQVPIAPAPLGPSPAPTPTPVVTPTPTPVVTPTPTPTPTLTPTPCGCPCACHQELEYIASAITTGFENLSTQIEDSVNNLVNTLLQLFGLGPAVSPPAEDQPDDTALVDPDLPEDAWVPDEE